MDWEKFMELENEDKGEYSYPTIFQDSKGKVHITYTFDRKNIKHVILEP
jgi:alpha-L-fucosidase